VAGEVTNIRNGIETRLLTISGLQVYDHEPDATTVTPAASIRLVSFTRNQTFESASNPGDRTYNWIVSVRLSGVVPEEQWQALDDYLAPTGTKSIQAAIDGDKTLGSTVDWAVVTTVDDIEIADRESRADGWYYVLEMPIESYVSG